MKTISDDTDASHARRSIWKYTPQRSRLRRAIFQVHLWIGVFLASYAILIGITGSLLVFANEIEQQLEPTLHLVQPEFSKAPLEPIMDRVRALHPSLRILSVTFARNPDNSESFTLLPAGRLDRSKVLSVYFNPYTGRILGERSTIQGPLGWTRNLHYFLFGGETGLIVNGVLGLALMLMCTSGIIIWWPGILRWKRALVVSPRANWRRLNWDLHSFIGFWSCAALLAVSFTGVYFAFPKTLTNLTLLSMGADMKQLQRSMAPAVLPFHQPGATMLSLDQAVARAQQALGPGSTLSYVTLPGTPQSTYTAVQYPVGSVPFSRSIMLDIDPYRGEVLRRIDTARYPLGMRVVLYYYTLHAGTFGGDGFFGFLLKTVWAFLGLAPVVLAVTGFLMYWNRSLRNLIRNSTAQRIQTSSTTKSAH